MKRSIITLVVALLVCAGAMGSASAQHMQGTPASSPMAGHHGPQHGNGAELSMGAAYLTITNTGNEPDRLLGAKTSVADVVEVHEVKMVNNVMEMSPLHDGLEIPAGETVMLKPGGYHIMLIGLTQSLMAGKSYEMTLTFEHAGDVTVTVPVLRGEPKAGDQSNEKVAVGDLELSGIWSRQSPKIDTGMATPMASPEATPKH